MEMYSPAPERFLPPPLARSRYGTKRIEILGRAAETAGGNAATGSSRYSFRSSSDKGTEAQKYEKVLLSGIISLRNRSANWRTLSLERSSCADMKGLPTF